LRVARVQASPPEKPEEPEAKPLLKALQSGTWSPEEDAALMNAVKEQTNGPTPVYKTWRQLSRAVAGRTGKQCRERWHNHLDPTVQKKPWSPEELAVLETAHQVHGNKWSTIALLLPGRTDNQVKNRVNLDAIRRLREQIALGYSSPRAKGAARNARANDDDDDDDVCGPPTLQGDKKKRKRALEPSLETSLEPSLANDPDDSDDQVLRGNELDTFLNDLISPIPFSLDDVKEPAPRKPVVKRRLSTKALLATEPPLSLMPERAPSTLLFTLGAPPRKRPPVSGRGVTFPGELLGSSHLEMNAQFRAINATINKNAGKGP
jgi:hypothetical protein